MATHKAGQTYYDDLLALAYSRSMITIMLAEEKKRKTWKLLFSLSGIQLVEYFNFTLFYPVKSGSTDTIASFNVSVKRSFVTLDGIQRHPVSVAICVIFTGTISRCLTDTQAKQVNGVIPMDRFYRCVLMLMMWYRSDTLYIYGELCDFFCQDDSPNCQSFIVPGVWIVVLLRLELLF